MERNPHDFLSEQLFTLIELSRRPNLSSGARAVLRLQIADIQDRLLKLSR